MAQATSIKSVMWFARLSAISHLCLTSEAVALELKTTEGRLCGSANSAHVGSGDALPGKFPAFAGRLRASTQHPTSKCESVIMLMSSTALFGFFGMPGHIELPIVAGIAVLFFGNRLPGVMRSMGRSVVEFKKGVQGIEDELDSAVDEKPSKD